MSASCVGPEKAVIIESLRMEPKVGDVSALLSALEPPINVVPLMLGSEIVLWDLRLLFLGSRGISMGSEKMTGSMSRSVTTMEVS